MALILKRLRAVSEIAQYLAQKEYSPEVIENTICKLAGYRYLDDDVFAKEFISFHRGEWGIKKLEHELRQKNICSEIISKHLNEDFSQVEEITRIIEKFSRGKTLDKQKVFNYLLRKGFLIDEIKKSWGCLSSP